MANIVVKCSHCYDQDSVFVRDGAHFRPLGRAPRSSPARETGMQVVRKFFMVLALNGTFFFAIFLMVLDADNSEMLD
jgi:hypothetical protein